jgi:hypothetical protein
VNGYLLFSELQITNNKSQMTNSFRKYNQPNTDKNYLVHYAWMPEQYHRGLDAYPMGAGE